VSGLYEPAGVFPQSIDISHRYFLFHIHQCAAYAASYGAGFEISADIVRRNAACRQ
jgi:hypothetical protein